MKILITGAGGFIGSHTANILSKKDYEIVLVDNHSRHGNASVFKQFKDNTNVKVHDLDLTQEINWKNLGENYDAIFHFAAINGTRHFYERPYEVIQINLSLLQNCIKWHSQNSPNAHIIWTSSSEVYAGVKDLLLPTPEETPVGIDDIKNPRYSYSISKLAGEILLINYGRSTKSLWTIVRPHNIYGPSMGFEHVIPEFLIRVYKKEDPFKIYGADTTRTFCYIEDFVRGLLLILETKNAIGEVIHLGNENDEITMVDLAKRLFRLFDWYPDLDVHQPPSGSTPRRCPSIAKARRILGFNPTVNLDIGLELTYEWYSKNYNSMNLGINK